MADELLDGGFAGADETTQSWDFVLFQNVFSTSPVGQSEVGITPDLEDPFDYPPDYQGTPPSEGHLVLEEITEGSAIDGGLIFSSDGVESNIAAPVGHAEALGPTPAAICVLFEDDLYGRIVLTPVLMAFGNVLQQQSDTAELWNSFFVSKTLNSIGETGTQGITLIRPGSAPTEPAVYAALQSRIYTVQASEVGPAAIDATYTFDFTPDFSPVLSVTGQRVVAFPYCYERPLREVLEFKTDVIESESGNEQRISTRKLPRQLFQVRYLLTDQNERQRAFNAIYGFHGQFYAVPLFHWARNLTSAASITDTTIFVDFSNADFRDTTADKEHLLILWRSPTDFEIVQIALNGLATPGQIDIELPLDQNHGVETLVVPMQFSLPKDPFQFTETQNNVVAIEAQWLSNDYGDLADLSSLATLDGIPILADTGTVIQKNLIEGNQLEQGFKIKYDLFDSIGGDFTSIVGRTVPETMSFLGIEVRNEADAFTLREILYGLKGKQKSFWLPSFRNDFQLTQAIGAADLNITFEEQDFDRFAADGPDPWGGIMVELLDGTQFFRTITGSTPAVGGEEAITWNAATGQAITIAEIRFVSMLQRMRFAQDRISIEHTQVGTIRLRVPVVGVKESA